MRFDYVERGGRPRLSRRGRSIASRAECCRFTILSTMCSVEFLEIECFSSSRCASSFLTHEKRFSLLSFVKPGWSTTGRVPVRALRATHPIHRPIWVCLIRRLLRRSRVRFLPNRTREQTPTKSVGRKAQRESDISSIFTSRGR